MGVLAAARRAVLPFTVALAAASIAGAAVPEKAPAECRRQIEAAVHLLAPALTGRHRAKAGGPGTLEAAILAYAPGRFHTVAEGALPASRAARETNACPPDMSAVAGLFCVDRYEGSLVTRSPDGGFVAHAPYLPPADGEVVYARSAKGVVPQGYISASQAAGACEASGKRLCQPVEWRAACGGSEGYAFPYGPQRRPGACRDSGKSPMLAYHAATMARGWGPAELNDPRLLQLEDTVAKTGEAPGCVDDRGIHDMVGNLHEWTADPNGTFQGGYWLDTALHGEGCAYRTIAHGYGYRDYSTGFRCCKDLAP